VGARAFSNPTGEGFIQVSGAQADERDHRLGTQDHVSKWQLADVQSLAGHTSLADTQRYIDQSPETKRRVVAM
jgi:hypothetical protein